MQIDIPPKVRIALYILTGVGTPIISVLTAPDIHVLPQWVMLIWSGEVTFVGAMAALRVSK